MYKSFKITGKYRLTFNVFQKTAKRVSKVYWSGIRTWVADDSYNYSVVFGTFRIIFSIERTQFGSCNV